MYTHCRQFPHLRDLKDDEIRDRVRIAMARHPGHRAVMRMRNRVVYLVMGAALIWAGWSLLFSPERRFVGWALLILGGAATLLLLAWNLVWINCVLYPITKLEADEHVSKEETL